MYCEIADVRCEIKEDAVESIIDEKYMDSTDEEVETHVTELIENAINDADAEIDGYLNKRYSVPLSNPPKVIRKFSKDITLYNIFSRRGIEEGTREENILNRYKAAITYLTNVAKGILDIGIESGETSVSTPIYTFKVSSQPRVFSRGSLRGM